MPRHRIIRLAVVSVAIVAASHLLDRWAWQHVVNPGVYDRDFGRMLRVIGYLPLWAILALAHWLHTRDRRRASMLLLVPAAGGLLAEVMKILLRRERPNLHDGEYFFRAFADQPIATKAIGLPSSHALVAFAGMFLLARFYPRASVLWVVLAIGCALGRVQAHAHFLSDVAVAGVAGLVLVDVIWSRWGDAA